MRPRLRPAKASKAHSLSYLISLRDAVEVINKQPRLLRGVTHRPASIVASAALFSSYLRPQSLVSATTMGTPSCPTPTNKLNSLNSACNSAAAASAAAAAKAAATASAVAQSSAATSSNLVRVGALPPHLNDEQVRELVSAFGVLKHFSLPKAPGNPAHSLGYALIEYEATEITDVAVSALNSLEICGKALEVKRPTMISS